MRVHAVFSGLVAAVLALALVPLGCGGAQEDYVVVSQPSEQASAPAQQEGQVSEADVRQIRTCFEGRMGQGPVRLRYDAKVNDRGEVLEVKLRSTTMQDAVVEGCLRQAIAAMTVPEQALRKPSSRPFSGGERMMREQRGPLGDSDAQCPTCVWLGLDLFAEWVGAKISVEALWGAIAAIGTIVVAQNKKDDCRDKYVECMDSPLGDRQVDKRGTTLCETCRSLCQLDGFWPSAVKVTHRWESCRY